MGPLNSLLDSHVPLCDRWPWGWNLCKRVSWQAPFFSGSTLVKRFDRAPCTSPNYIISKQNQIESVLLFLEIKQPCSCWGWCNSHPVGRWASKTKLSPKKTSLCICCFGVRCEILFFFVFSSHSPDLLDGSLSSIGSSTDSPGKMEGVSPSSSSNSPFASLQDLSPKWGHQEDVKDKRGPSLHAERDLAPAVNRIRSFLWVHPVFPSRLLFMKAELVWGSETPPGVGWGGGVCGMTEDTVSTSC